MTINNFGPFNVEVWGSVSDWSLVIVTIITAYFIWKTLHEQVIINKVSINKDRRDVRPEFKIIYDSEDLTFKLYVTNATAINVIIHNKSHVEKPQNITVWHKEFKKVVVPEYSIWTICFKDEDGREYKQEISGNKDGVFIDFPRLLKDVF